MFAVIGAWITDPALAEDRASTLPDLVKGVSQNAGFVAGYWCDEIDDPSASTTFIVFETLDQARRFQAAVVGNAAAQTRAGVDRGSLRIVEVKAHA